jgi:hypothetical protein
VWGEDQRRPQAVNFSDILINSLNEPCTCPLWPITPYKAWQNPKSFGTVYQMWNKPYPDIANYCANFMPEIDARY